MTKAATWLLTAGALLFIGVLASQGLPAILSALAAAGWGLVLVALFHLLPLALDAAAIRVLFAADAAPASLRDSLLTRWVGESANSFLPAGQLGGPVLMARHLAHRGMPMRDAAAAITVSTTPRHGRADHFRVVWCGPVGRAGGAYLGARSADVRADRERLLAVQIGGFYLLQRRGFFSKLIRAATRFAGKRDWSEWVSRAEAIDLSIQGITAGAVASRPVFS